MVHGSGSEVAIFFHLRFLAAGWGFRVAFCIASHRIALHMLVLFCLRWFLDMARRLPAFVIRWCLAFV
jgi:hypothetical protein